MSSPFAGYECLEQTQPRLRLLGRFELGTGSSTPRIGESAQRLLAFLALQGRAVDRLEAAQTLWPDGSNEQASANLRSLLRRLRSCCSMAVRATACEIRLGQNMAVDVAASIEVCCQILDRSVELTDGQLSGALQAELRQDLLPNWTEDDWILPERARFRQLRLHALEVLCERLSAAGWHGAAVDAGLAVVRADPFRESARRALIKAYVAEGNRLEAHREFQDYERLLRNELHAEPSAAMRRLLYPRLQCQPATGIHVTSPCTSVTVAPWKSHQAGSEQL